MRRGPRRRRRRARRRRAWTASSRVVTEPKPLLAIERAAEAAAQVLHQVAGRLGVQDGEVGQAQRRAARRPGSRRWRGRRRRRSRGRPGCCAPARCGCRPARRRWRRRRRWRPRRRSARGSPASRRTGRCAGWCRATGTGAAGSRWRRGSRRRREPAAIALRAAATKSSTVAWRLVGGQRVRHGVGLLARLRCAPRRRSRRRDGPTIRAVAVMSGWETRPPCISCMTIVPPRACTASVTRRQPATCSSVRCRAGRRRTALLSGRCPR